MQTINASPSSALINSASTYKKTGTQVCMLRKILLSTKTSELVNYIKRQYDNITLSYCQKLIELNLMLKTKADFQVTDRLTKLTKVC